MQNIDWKGLVEAVIALLTAITAAIAIANNAHLNAIKKSQEDVAKRVDALYRNGQGLSDYLAKTRKDAP